MMSLEQRAVVRNWRVERWHEENYSTHDGAVQHCYWGWRYTSTVYRRKSYEEACAALMFRRPYPGKLRIVPDDPSIV